MSDKERGESDQTESLVHGSDAASACARLLVFCDERLTSYELPLRGTIIVGRANDCDVPIAHRSISRQHVAIHVRGAAGVAVEDLGSANGTRVAGRKLTPKKAEPLPAGAVIEIGLATLVVREPRAEASSLNLAGALPTAMEGGSPMDRVRDLVKLVAATDLTVLLLGETGVGKEVTAGALHASSPRRDKPFVTINCAALPEALLESELFGHERGAFSGAVQTKTGLLEAADGGTLLLDEIGELPLAMQAKLLRAIEAREVTRLGAIRPRAIDVRFIAATNRALHERVARGEFRADLFHRLNGVAITIPPLRERRDEIASLAARFAHEACARVGAPSSSREALPLTARAIAHLGRQEWPGNVRELRNVVERAVMLARGAGLDVIDVAQLVDPLAPPSSSTLATPDAPPSTLRSDLAALERGRIEEALRVAGGNQTKAASLLGISRRTLIGRLDAYGLPRPRKGAG